MMAVRYEKYASGGVFPPSCNGKGEKALMKNFEEAKLNVVEFDANVVIATSGNIASIPEGEKGSNDQSRD